MAGMFSNTFSSSASDPSAADPQQPSDPLTPDPVVYDNPDSPDDRGPGQPADDFGAGDSSQTSGGDFGDGGF